MWIWSKLKYIYNLTYNREKGAYFTNVVLYVHIFKAYEKQCLVEFSNAKSQNLQWQEVNKTHALFALISREKLTAKFSRERKKKNHNTWEPTLITLFWIKWVNEIVNKQLGFVNKQLIICKQMLTFYVLPSQIRSCSSFGFCMYNYCDVMLRTRSYETLD